LSLTFYVTNHTLVTTTVIYCPLVSRIALFGVSVIGCAFVSAVLALPALHPYQRPASGKPKRPMSFFVFVETQPAPNKALGRYEKYAHASLLF
jgi:hypothetical protein